MTEVPSVPQYSGDMPNRAEQDRDTFADNIFLYIKWSGTTFLTNFNLVVEKINAVATDINNTFDATSDLKDDVGEIRDETGEIRDEVIELRDVVAATMGATYYKYGWNSTHDFGGEFTSHNGNLWISLSSPNINSEPTHTNNNWSSFTGVSIPELFTSKDIASIVYDVNSNIKSITYEDGSKSSYYYDANDDLTKIDFFKTDGVTEIGTQTFTYNDNGYLTTTNYTGV